MPRVFLIDTDTASDDAVAIIMALRTTDVRVAAITTVAGNVPAEQATRNALYVAELCDVDVPVYSCCTSPLWRRYEDATWFHGKYGLVDRGDPPPNRSPETAHAVEAIIHTVQSNPGIGIVPLGPLTNVALALKQDPKI